MRLFRDLSDLFFPNTCCVCHTPLVGDEKGICMRCLNEMPEAMNAHGTDNFVMRRMMGRVPAEAASSLFIYKRKNLTQKVVHSIKYYGNEQLGIVMGQQLGLALSRSGEFDGVDILMPVPLHRRKERIRGYNQSLLLCKGMAMTLGRPISEGNLVRTRHTETQTRKSREERLDNMQGVFRLSRPDELEDKHVLLVDDVLTTGSTTEGCWEAMRNVKGLRISIATLAVSGDT